MDRVVSLLSSSQNEPQNNNNRQNTHTTTGSLHLKNVLFRFAGSLLGVGTGSGGRRGVAAGGCRRWLLLRAFCATGWLRRLPVRDAGGEVGRCVGQRRVTQLHKCRTVVTNTRSVRCGPVLGAVGARRQRHHRVASTGIPDPNRPRGCRVRRDQYGLSR